MTDNSSGCSFERLLKVCFRSATDRDENLRLGCSVEKEQSQSSRCERANTSGG